jgi:hypothetical protein
MRLKWSDGNQLVHFEFAVAARPAIFIKTRVQCWYHAVTQRMRFYDQGKCSIRLIGQLH